MIKTFIKYRGECDCMTKAESKKKNVAVLLLFVLPILPFYYAEFAVGFCAILSCQKDYYAKPEVHNVSARGPSRQHSQHARKFEVR